MAAHGAARRRTGAERCGCQLLCAVRPRVRGTTPGLGLHQASTPGDGNARQGAERPAAARPRHWYGAHAPLPRTVKRGGSARTVARVPSEGYAPTPVTHLTLPVLVVYSKRHTLSRGEQVAGDGILVIRDSKSVV